MPSRFIRVQAASSVVIRQITLRHSLIGRITNGQKILPLTTRSKHSISRSGNHDDIRAGIYSLPTTSGKLPENVKPSL